jgi:hypothetical protein
VGDVVEQRLGVVGVVVEIVGMVVVVWMAWMDREEGWWVFSPSSPGLLVCDDAAVSPVLTGSRLVSSCGGSFDNLGGCWVEKGGVLSALLLLLWCSETGESVSSSSW